MSPALNNEGASFRASLADRPVPSDRFTFFTDKTGAPVFVGEASDLRGLALQAPLYDDAADVGFVMRSAKSGSLAVFHLSETQEDAEGDVICWVFLPTSATVRREPRMAKARVRIFND